MAFWESKRKANPSIKSGSLASYRSAVTFYLDNCTESAKRERWNAGQRRKLSQSLRGLKNKGADLVRTGEASGEIGKRHLPVTEYRQIAEATLLLGPGGVLSNVQVPNMAQNRHITSLHLFVSLAWNLVMRSDSVTALHSRHIDWANDALQIGVNKSKRHENEDFEYYSVVRSRCVHSCIRRSA